MARIEGKCRGRRLRLEQLEERIAPAGAVTVSVRGGSLFVTGDNLDNDIEIDQDGLLGDQYRISSGDNATLINGQAGPLVFNGVTWDVNIRLGRGDDELLIDGVGVARHLKVDGGDGNNYESIFADVAGNLKLKNGKGNQDIELDVDVGKNLNVRNGMGDVDIHLYAGVGGNASISNSKGEHLIDIEDSVFERNLQITSRSSETNTVIDFVDIHGNLTIKNTKGVDLLLINDVLAWGNVQINNGRGDTVTAISDNTEIYGNVTVKALDGLDQFVVDTSHVYGRLKLNYGHGGSRTDILFSELGMDDHAVGSRTSNTVIKAGRGFDKLVVEDSALGRNLNINYGHGGSTTLVLGTAIGGKLTAMARRGVDTFSVRQTEVWGKTRINFGMDADAFFADDSEFGSAVINLGNGDDLIALDTMMDGGFDEATVFFGRVKLLGGNGDDFFALGTFSEPSAFVVFNESIRVNGGGGFDTLDDVDNGNVYLGPMIDISIEDLF